MPNRKAPGRRRAPKPPLSRRVASVISTQVAVKSLAVAGVVGAATASVALPASGSASTASVLTTSPDAAAGAALAQARTTAVLGASRSSGRVALSGDTATTSPAFADAAVAAPEAATPVSAGAVGVQGFEAVAKPPTETNLDAVAPGSAGAAGAGASASASGSSVYVGAGYSTSAFAGMCAGLGMSPNAIGVCSAVRSLFGVSNIGGLRAGDWGDHGTGHAVDVMTSDFGQGDAIAAFLQEHAGEFGIKYLIWKQRYWQPGGSWSMMEDRGSPTQNHFDHVHVSVN